MRFTMLKLPISCRTTPNNWPTCGWSRSLAKCSQVGGGFSADCTASPSHCSCFSSSQAGPGAPILLWARQIGFRAFKAPAAGKTLLTPRRTQWSRLAWVVVSSKYQNSKIKRQLGYFQSQLIYLLWLIYCEKFPQLPPTYPARSRIEYRVSASGATYDSETQRGYQAVGTLNSFCWPLKWQLSGGQMAHGLRRLTALKWDQFHSLVELHFGIAQKARTTCSRELPWHCAEFRCRILQEGTLYLWAPNPLWTTLFYSPHCPLKWYESSLAAMTTLLPPSVARQRTTTSRWCNRDFLTVQGP